MTAERREKIQHLLDHLLTYTADGDVNIFRWIIWWFRRVIVECKKPDMVLMFVGNQGAGKTVIFRIFGDILGDELYLSLGTLDEFLTNFNKIQSQKLLIYIQEFGRATGNQKILYDKFKARVDQQKISVEAKYVDTVQEINRAGIGASSNNPDMIRAADGDRRGIFLKCSDKVCDNDEYWDDFYEKYPEVEDNPELNKEISDILYSYLHSEECKNFVELDPVTGKKHKYFRPPKTELRDTVIEQSRNLGEEYISELMTKTKKIEPETIIKLAGSGSYFLLSDRIWDCFFNWMCDRHVKSEHQMSRNKFILEVGKWLKVKSSRTKTLNGERAYGYRIDEDLYKKLVTEWEEPDFDEESDDE